jgi:hypothetical protein
MQPQIDRDMSSKQRQEKSLLRLTAAFSALPAPISDCENYRDLNFLIHLVKYLVTLQ